jgi:TonB family protein
VKIIFPFLLLFIPANTFCQIFWPSQKDSVPPTNEEIAATYYYQGVENYENENFLAADSLYSLSVNKFPSINAYYNQALIKNKQNDICSFCNCLKKATLLGDQTSVEYYNKYCVANDTDLLKYYKINLPLFKQAIIQDPNPDAFMNMAVAAAKLGDKCTFCENLESIYLSDLPVIQNLAIKKCYAAQNILISDSTEKGNRISNTIYTESCNKKKKYTYLELTHSGDTVLYLKSSLVQAGRIVNIEVNDLLSDSVVYSLKIDTTELGAQLESLYDHKQIKVKKKPEEILKLVEIMPAYEGGEMEMYNWLGENVKYPKEAKENGTTGTVIVTFVVETDGSISNVKLLKDVGDGCGDEAIRVIKAMPKWTPGKQDGKPVRVQFTMPIRFTLENYSY